MTKRALRRLRQKDRDRALSAILSTAKSWRIIVETEEGGEWWSQPIRSAIKPTVELIEGVRGYRIEEI